MVPTLHPSCPGQPRPLAALFSPRAVLARLAPLAAVAWLGSGCLAPRSTLRDPRGAARAASPEAWIAAARHPLRFDPGAPVLPAGLVAACRGARVVGLGEFSHGTHEDAALKTALALALMDSGDVDTLYLEANRTGGEQLDAFLRSGGGEAREAVARADIFRVLKTEAFADLVAGMQQRVARGRRLRIVGIDCQDSRRDAEFALGRLAGRDATAAARLRAALQPIVGPEATRLRHPQLMQSLDSARIAAGVAGLAELERALAGDAAGVRVAGRARQGLLCFEHEGADGDPAKADAAYFSRRDRYMAENILADGARRGAFWGHNMHLVGGPREAVPEYVPTGTVLREALGRGYRIVVCDYQRARIRAVVVADGPAFPNALAEQEVLERGPVADGLAGAVAGGAGGSWWLDLAAMPAGGPFEAWRRTPRLFDWPGFAMPRERREEYLYRAALGQVLDVVVVFGEVGPARMLPVPAAGGP